MSDAVGALYCAVVARPTSHLVNSRAIQSPDARLSIPFQRAAYVVRNLDLAHVLSHSIKKPEVVKSLVENADLNPVVSKLK